MGRTQLNVTTGNLTIGDTVYQIQWGKGLINLRSSKMVLHLNVSSTDGATRHAVLNGRLTGKLASSLTLGAEIELNFTKPQSKLAREWLLELKGTLTRVA